MDTGCDGFAAHAKGGDAGDDGDESVDSELLLAYEKEEESCLFSRTRGDAKHHDAEGTQLPPSSALDLNMKDMCTRTATGLSILWPAVQSEAVKSHFHSKNLPKAKKMRK